MKIKQFLFVFAALTLLLFSCNSFFKKPDVQPREFWVKHFFTGEFYQITAKQLAEGKHSTIWVEEGINFSESKAKEIAETFDNIIFPRLMAVYALRTDITFGGQTFANVLELADWLSGGDGDGKLRILFFNRIESASYFIFTDLSKINSYHEWANYSNNSAMIYISNALFSASYLSGVIAHEFAHMINYLNGLVLERPQITQELWINEGLATGAEWLYHDGHPPYRWWRQYNVSRVTGMRTFPRLIDLGNLFWNHYSENPDVEWPDYFTPYLFFSWLRLQAGTTEIWHDIITSRYSGYRAVTEAANRHMPGYGYDDWGTLFKTWLAATYINAPDGPYGYKSDTVLRNIRAAVLPPGTANLNLAPGDGFFGIAVPGFTMPASTGNIRYVSLSLDPPALSDSEIFPGGVLLTYNLGTDIRGITESGISTGIPVICSIATKFEGEWIGSIPHAQNSHNNFTFNGNSFTFRFYENGRVMLRRHGRFVFTETEITFIPIDTGSWQGYTQRYTLNDNELELERDRRYPFAVVTRQ